jgi:hypothetical protein
MAQGVTGQIDLPAGISGKFVRNGKAMALHGKANLVQCQSGCDSVDQAGKVAWKGKDVIGKSASGPLMLAACWLIFAGPALAAEGYQTDLGPTPLDGSNRANVLGRGSVMATLEGRKFTLQGTFAGLATAATKAHICMGAVMGGMGPALYDVTVTPARSGQVSGSVTLTQEQVTALKKGQIYLLLDSQNAPKGNLWGWFQPAHKTVGPNVPEYGHWYIPNILQDDTRKKPQG